MQTNDKDLEGKVEKYSGMRIIRKLMESISKFLPYKTDTKKTELTNQQIHPNGYRDSCLCIQCDGTGRERSKISHSDGSEEEESRICVMCRGGQYITREWRNGQVYSINGVPVNEIPHLGDGW